MTRLATLLIAALFCVSAAAQDTTPGDELIEEEPLRHYSVEVIIFAYVEDVSVGSELFLPDEPSPEEELLFDEDGNPIATDDEEIAVYGDDVITADPKSEEDPPPAWIVVTAENAEPFSGQTFSATTQNANQEQANPFRLVLMNEDEFTLGDEIRQFELLDVYETIMHFGWTQPTYPEEETPEIELRLLSEVPEGLDGSFTLYLSRYLHLVVDLALDAPSEFESEVVSDDAFFSYGDERLRYDDNAEPEVMPVRFRIQENRIFKNGDLRYFDHPKFGVLAKITRIESEEVDDNTETDAEALARRIGQ